MKTGMMMTIHYMHLRQQFFSFAKSKEVSLMHALDGSRKNTHDLFHLPRSTIATEKCNELSMVLNFHHSIVLEKWPFSWGNNFSTKKVYQLMINSPKALDPFQWIWKSCILSNVQKIGPDADLWSDLS
jgi:hypothetical protein